MAIEISEIGILMRVRDDAAAPPDGRGTAPAAMRDIDREAIVAECVRRVLHALKTRQER